MATNPSLLPEIGPDGLARENPVIGYTERKIEEEQHQLQKYIQENYSRIRDVERELHNLTLEVKLTAGPKKAALEHLRKKIETSTEKIRIAKIKEEEARKAYEEASKVVKDEEATKQKLCEDLSQLVQESSNSQFSRLEELKRRLEAMNPSRPSISTQQDVIPVVQATTPVQPVVESAGAANKPAAQGQGYAPTVNGHIQQQKKVFNPGRGKGVSGLFAPKARGPGWTGAGFDVQ